MTKEEFLKNIGHYGSHRHLLWPALEATNDPENNHPVLELGCGDESTPFLKQYCKDNRRILRSFDSNKEWAEKHDSIYLPDWDEFQWFYQNQYSVVLIDEAPGEHRKVALELFSLHQNFDIIIIHDSEHVGWNSSDYQVRPLFSRFKYVKDLPSENLGGPWTTALSNHIDVTKFEV